MLPSRINNKTIDAKALFLSLIQPLPLKKPLLIDRNILNSIDTLAKKNNVWMLLYVQLKSVNNETLNSNDVSAYLGEQKKVFLANAARCMKQEEEEKNVISILAENNISAIVIKGNKIARQIYPDPYCRTSSDIDFLIPEFDIMSADDSLTKSGYIRTDPIPLKFWMNRIHHAAYTHPENRHRIEIHWNFGIPSYFNLTSEDIWREINKTDDGDLELSPGMQIIECIIHHSLHAYKELKILTDVLWTIYKYQKVIHWRPFVEKLSTIGMIKATGITLSQIQALWPDCAELFQDFIMRHQESNKYIRKHPKHLYRYFKIDIAADTVYHHTKDQFVVRFTLDGFFTILTAFIKTYLPRPGLIKVFFNDKRIWMLPFNYMKFIKWRVSTQTEK